MCKSQVVLSAGLQFYLVINDLTNLVYNFLVTFLLGSISKVSLTHFSLEMI